MPADEHVPALMAAFAVALSARTNMLTSHAVDQMRTQAEELLPRDHAAYPAIVSFATQYEIYHRDPDALARLGQYLEDSLHQAVGPQRQWRADIDG